MRHVFFKRVTTLYFSFFLVSNTPIICLLQLSFNLPLIVQILLLLQTTVVKTIGGGRNMDLMIKMVLKCQRGV